MPENTRLRIKRGDTAPAFRGQCQDGPLGTPVSLAGASARLLLKPDGAPGVVRSLPMVVESGVLGWVRRDWQAADTATVGTFRAEVEVTYAGGAVQTFPGSGYATVEILPDLG
jgi:hypothetical protein